MCARETCGGGRGTGGTGGFHMHGWARLLRIRHLPGPVSTGEARMRSAPRRVSAFVGVLAAVALLATACSSDKTTKSSTASNEPVTLQVNLFGTFGYKEAGLFDEYQRLHSNVKISYNSVEQEQNYYQALQTHLAAGSGLGDIQAIEVGRIAEIVQSRADKFVNFNDFGGPRSRTTSSPGSGRRRPPPTAGRSGSAPTSGRWPWPTAPTCSRRRACRPTGPRSPSSGRPGRTTSRPARPTWPTHRPARPSWTAPPGCSTPWSAPRPTSTTTRAATRSTTATRW